MARHVAFLPSIDPSVVVGGATSPHHDFLFGSGPSYSSGEPTDIGVAVQVPHGDHVPTSDASHGADRWAHDISSDAHGDAAHVLGDIPRAELEKIFASEGLKIGDLPRIHLPEDMTSEDRGVILRLATKLEEAAAVAKEGGTAVPHGDPGGAFQGVPGLPGSPFGDHTRLTEAGFHLDLSVLKTMRTGVLLAGTTCSRLFGLGLMAYLAFQSMQANVAQPQPQPQRQACQDRRPRA